MENKTCKTCGKVYANNKRLRCNACTTKIRRIRTKNAAIKYLGGKCKRCGYDKHSAALEFHHLRDKEFNIGNVANKKWETIKAELNKCELLCSNCHRIEHSNRSDQRFIDAVNEYNGKELL